MNNLHEWLAKFFGHIPVKGLEAMSIKGLQAVLVLLAVYLLLNIVLRSIEHYYRKSDPSHSSDIKIYKNIVRYSFWILGILAALHVAGLNLSSVFTTSGLFALAIGFALKDITGNYIGGIILKSNDSIKVGDVLNIAGSSAGNANIDGNMVLVNSIGLRYTTVRAKDGLDILIPNSVLVGGNIGNYTHRDSVCRVMTTIGVSYSSDMRKVKEVLQKACDSLGGLSKKFTSQVRLNDFGNSSVNFNVYVYIEIPWNRRIIKSNLNEAVWWALKDADIEIAFPQLDVHFDANSNVTPPN